jgi:energy-converting hydrogenase Eha subunit B
MTAGLCVQLSDTVVVALLNMLGIVIAAFVTGLAMVTTAWLQSRHRGPS